MAAVSRGAWWTALLVMGVVWWVGAITVVGWVLR